MQRASGSRGFTLLELMAVFAVIAMILAVAAPRLLPLATYFGHEGSARQLAAFGETAIQHAKLNSEELYVKFDLETGAYWIEHWVPEDSEDGAGEGASGIAEMEETITEMLNDPNADPDDLIEGAKELQKHFSGFAEQRLRARAELVEPNRSREEDENDGAMRASWGDGQKNRPMKKETLVAPLLEKRQLPENVFFESVTLPDERTSGDIVEVVISPLGLERDVRIKLVSEDGDVLTVRWDPIVSRGFVYAGDWDE